MHLGAGAHSVDASKPGGLGCGVSGKGRSGLSVSPPFAAKTVSTASYASASTGVSLAPARPGLPPLLGSRVPSPSLSGQCSGECLAAHKTRRQGPHGCLLALPPSP
jgi:hypothetical protein